MNEIIAKMIESGMPIRVQFDYQPYREAEEIDGLTSPEIKPHIEILSLSFGGYDIDMNLNGPTVEDIRTQCFNHMSKAIT